MATVKTNQNPIRKWAKAWTEDIEMADKHIKRCWTLLAIRKIQIKIIMRYYHTSIRMVKIKNTNRTKCWQGCRETVSLILCWWECKIVHPLWKSVWKFLKMLNTHLPYGPSITFLDTYSRKRETHSHKILNRNTCRNFVNRPKLETTQISFNGWMAKQTVVHPYNGILLSNKKKPTTDTFSNLNEF